MTDKNNNQLDWKEIAIITGYFIFMGVLFFILLGY